MLPPPACFARPWNVAILQDACQGFKHSTDVCIPVMYSGQSGLRGKHCGYLLKKCPVRREDMSNGHFFMVVQVPLERVGELNKALF